MTKPKYTPDYFIDKFSAIPDEKWTTDTYFNAETGACCALGHTGWRWHGDDEEVEKTTIEGRKLNDLFKKKYGHYFSVVEVNDGSVKRYQQPTPKLRVLAALEDLKK